MTAWKTISRPVQFEITKRKGSCFISAAWPLLQDNVTALDLVQRFIEIQRTTFPGANHHFRLSTLDGRQGCSDDGEPHGTGGRPILVSLQRAQLVDVCVVVTRMFGGVKLGSGGLIRAYGAAAQAVLEQAQIVDNVPTRFLHVHTAFLFVDMVKRACSQCSAEFVSQAYAEDALFRSVSLSTRVTNLSALSKRNQQNA